MDEPRRPTEPRPPARVAAGILVALLLAALSPVLFPFRPFTRAYYDPWAGVGTVVAVVLALLSAGQDRRLVLGGAVVAFLAGTAMAFLGVLDFNFLRAALALFAVGGAWLGGSTRRVGWAAVPATLSAGVLALALVWHQMEAISGQPGMLGAGAALALLAATWVRHRRDCPTRCRLAVGVLVAAGVALAGFLLLKEYAVPPVNGLREQTILYNALTATLSVLVVVLAAHWPTGRHLGALLAAAALLLVPAMLGSDPEAAFLLPFFVIGALATVAGLFGLGWLLRRLYERGKVAAGDG